MITHLNLPRAKNYKRSDNNECSHELNGDCLGHIFLHDRFVVTVNCKLVPQTLHTPLEHLTHLTINPHFLPITEHWHTFHLDIIQSQQVELRMQVGHSAQDISHSSQTKFTHTGQ